MAGLIEQVESVSVPDHGDITDEQWNIFGKGVFSDRKPVADGRRLQVRLESGDKSLLR